MANNKSAKKRIRINERNNLNNKFYKGSIKSLFKLFSKNLKESERNIDTDKQLINLKNLLYSKIDKATRKNILHKNSAARKKAQISKFLHKN
tara:strand:+ start:194 stop:469 length:276 start_codon:yes stop_codon:yes gene_type:complete